MERRHMIALALFAVVLTSGCLGYGGQTDTSAGTQTDTQTTEEEAQEVQSGEVTVEYTAAGFQPSTITITEGTTVTWVSNGPSMWVASAVHPTHERYGGTSLQEHCNDPDATPFDQCESGQEFSFTFTQTGAWNYHDHRSPGRTGTVVVQ